MTFIFKIFFLLSFIASQSFLFNLNAQAKSAADIIVQRLRQQNHLRYTKDADIEKILKLYKNGRFKGVSYIKTTTKKSNFPQKKHMEYLAAIASGYLNKKSKFYRKDKIKKIFLNGLFEWCKVDPRDKNWWWRSIGGPKRFLPMVAAMSVDIKKDKKVRKAIGEYFINNWNGKLNADSNSTQMAQMALFGYALLGDDRNVLKVAKIAAGNLIKIQMKLRSDRLPNEGIQCDYGFNLHGGSGAQNYWANYGSVYLGNINWWVSIFNKTKFAFPKKKLAIISNCYLKGCQWVSYNNNLDIMVAGRFSEDARTASSRLLGPLNGFLRNNPPQKKQLEKFVERLKNKKSNENNYLQGTRAFWMHDQLVHRKKKFYISLNMSSKRSVANEFGNGAGQNNYYTGSGMMSILVDGNEMPRNLFKKWNWRKLPGTTVLQDAGKLPLIFWGQKGINGTDFAGSVVNGKNGVSGFKYSRKGVEANKAWFFFDKGCVALGNNIKSDQKHEVLTTINQVLKAKAADKSISDNKILYNKVGYFSPSKILFEEKDNLAWFGFNHGKKPKAKSYEYLIFPNLNKNEFNSINSNKIYKVIANNNKIQAIKFPKGMFQAVFYKKGTLKVSNSFTITVSSPVILLFKMIAKDQALIYCATPYGYNEKNNVIDIAIKYKNKCKEISLAYKSGLLKGMTRGAKIKF